MNAKIAIAGIAIIGLLVFSAFFVLLPNPNTNIQTGYASASTVTANTSSSDMSDHHSGQETSSASSAVNNLPSQVGGC
ncbi:MAG: hypothetical protein AABW72_04100 [archaeon]